MHRTVAAALAILWPGLAVAGPVDGLWRTEANDAGEYLVVSVGPCEDDASRTCGVIERAMTARGEAPGYRHLGRSIITGMVQESPTEWSDGEIWAPDDDRTYSASMTLSGDVLTVEGCVLVICRSQDWRRVE